MNSLLLLVAMLIPGPDFENPKQNFYILIDTTSKDMYIRRRSQLVKELEIKNDKWLPNQLYYLHNKYNFIIQELPDVRYNATDAPAFKIGKNAAWESFAPGTFAADGTFTLSVYSIAKWEEFEQELFDGLEVISVSDSRERKTWCLFPYTFPNSFIKHYNKRKVFTNAPYTFCPLILEDYLNGLNLPEWPEE